MFIPHLQAPDAPRIPTTIAPRYQNRALLSPQNFFCRFHPPDRCLEGLQSSVRITAPGHCPLEKGSREVSMPTGRTQTHPSDQANIKPSNPIKSLSPLHGSRGRWTHTPSSKQTPAPVTKPTAQPTPSGSSTELVASQIPEENPLWGARHGADTPAPPAQGTAPWGHAAGPHPG